MLKLMGKEMFTILNSNISFICSMKTMWSVSLTGEASKQIHEYKLKLQKADQEITNLEGTVIRLETQVKRFKYDADEAEKLEDELKTDRRRLQREVSENIVRYMVELSRKRTEFEVVTFLGSMNFIIWSHRL